MKKVFNLVRDHHNLFYRIGLFATAIVLCVYLMPRKKSFKYEPIEGKYWPHESLISDLEFSILKSVEKIAIEQQQVIDNQKFVFKFERSKLKEARQEFDSKLDYFSKIAKENKPTLKSQKEHNKYVNRLVEQARSIWNDIYKKGVLQSNPNVVGKELNYLLLVDRGQGKESAYLGDFNTMTAAKIKIENISIESKDDYKELTNILIKNLTENYIFNPIQTQERLKYDQQKIAKVNGKVSIGELIVSKGEMVTPKIYLKLISYKKEFEGDQISSSATKYILLGQLLLIGLCFLIVFLFIRAKRVLIFNDTSALKFLLLNIVLFVAFARLTVSFSNNNLIYLVPFCALPLVIRSFFDLRLALFIYTIAIVLIGWLAPNPFHFVFVQLMAGILSILTVNNLYKRSDLFISVGKISLVYFLSYLGISLITTADIFGQDYSVYFYLMVSAVLTLFTYPLVYVNEKLFSLVSDISLLELSDTNHPLLKEMSEKAPGTFHHSLQVCNLAEHAAMEVEGNLLLMRVGALYHDIGKIDNPLFFIENQVAGINPHDELSSDESARVIISHVIRGVEKAKKHNLPEQVIDFIRTHHGERVVQYFYSEHLKKFPDMTNDMEKFKYPGPKPFSKETAILMMADSVEAAARSLNDKNADNINDLVHKIIENQMRNGQFNDAEITLKEISKIKKSFIKKLLSMHHLRIEYPSL
jgi:putative nucleotidyltransferase with HDIG domain